MAAIGWLVTDLFTRHNFCCSGRQSPTNLRAAVTRPALATLEPRHARPELNLACAMPHGTSDLAPAPYTACRPSGEGRLTYVREGSLYVLNPHKESLFGNYLPFIEWKVMKGEVNQGIHCAIWHAVTCSCLQRTKIILLLFLTYRERTDCIMVMEQMLQNDCFMEIPRMKCYLKGGEWNSPYCFVYMYRRENRDRI